MAEAPKEAQRAVVDSIALFLESTPPGLIVGVKEDFAERNFRIEGSFTFHLPPIQLHCANEKCNGVRTFQSRSVEASRAGTTKDHFIVYVCRNCNTTVKTFAIRSNLDNTGVTGTLYKFGEIPAFGPPTPARVITLLGPERDYFLKGRRAENQSMGIAAFAYYRRAVETQKGRIFDEIIRVSEKIGAAPETLADLKDAKKETQFSKAVDAVKHGIPQALLINGHNPLTLLHSALSEGLHAQTDEQCLELATSIRVVLAELAERLGAALKDEAELDAAVGRLLKKQ